MRYFYIIPAAVIVAGILVGHAQVERDVPSAPTPVAAVNPSGATSVMPSPPASVSSVAPEARATVETGNGGDGGQSEAAVSPTSTATAVATVEDVADSNLPQPSVTVTRALEAQVDEQRPSKPQGAGSSPAGGFNNLEAAIEAAFPPSEWATAYKVSMCESGGNPDAPTGAAGEEGAFQVIPKYHGAVPSDLYGQAEQAAEIVAQYGWSAWSCYYQ